MSEEELPKPKKLRHCLVCDLVYRNIKVFSDIYEKLKKGECMYIDDPLGTSEWISRGGWGHQSSLRIKRDLDEEGGEKIGILEISKITQHTSDEYDDGADLSDAVWVDEFEEWTFYLEIYHERKKMKIEDCEEVHHCVKDCFHENLDYIVALIENQSNTKAEIPPLDSKYKVNLVEDETNPRCLRTRE